LLADDAGAGAFVLVDDSGHAASARRLDHRAAERALDVAVRIEHGLDQPIQAAVSDPVELRRHGLAPPSDLVAARAILFEHLRSCLRSSGTRAVGGPTALDPTLERLLFRRQPLGQLRRALS